MVGPDCPILLHILISVPLNYLSISHSNPLCRVVQKAGLEYALRRFIPGRCISAGLAGTTLSWGVVSRCPAPPRCCPALLVDVHLHSTPTPSTIAILAPANRPKPRRRQNPCQSRLFPRFSTEGPPYDMSHLEAVSAFVEGAPPGEVSPVLKLPAPLPEHYQADLHLSSAML
jgi:hypothetical protein